MVVSAARSRFMKRGVVILIAIATGIALTGATMFVVSRYKEWRDARAQQERITRASTGVKAGMTPVQIEALLGPPTFREVQSSEMLTPSSEDCEARHRASFIYQALPEPTLVVFFDEQGTCHVRGDDPRVRVYATRFMTRRCRK